MPHTVKSLRAIVVTYLGATDTQPSRVKLYLPMFKKSQVFQVDYNIVSTDLQAIKILKKNGIKVVARTAVNHQSSILLVNYDDGLLVGKVAKFFKL
jgi:hypothetical protein